MPLKKKLLMNTRTSLLTITIIEIELLKQKHSLFQAIDVLICTQIHTMN